MSDQMTQSEQESNNNDAPSGGWLRRAWYVEFGNLRFGLLVYPLLARLLPEGRANGFRTSLLRAVGLQIGAGTLFAGMPRMQTARPGPLAPRIQIGTNCVFGRRIILEFGDVLTIGDRVSMADGVVVLTTTHELGPKEHRAGTVIRHPVVIGNDVSLGEDSIVLPGAVLGDGARVMPRSVVNSKVAAGATVSGIPARPVRK